MTKLTAKVRAKVSLVTPLNVLLISLRFLVVSPVQQVIMKPQSVSFYHQHWGVKTVVHTAQCTESVVDVEC